MGEMTVEIAKIGPERGGYGYRAGFTLIELMIVVSIVAILLAVALPSFQKQVQRGNRAAAQSEMYDAANRQQQYLLANRSYMTQAIFDASSFSLDNDVADNYTLTIAAGAGPPPTFTITMTPKSGSTQAGDVTLTLNEQGKGTPEEYWER
jgi:type IV pilus assembly protein PilE